MRSSNEEVIGARAADVIVRESGGVIMDNEIASSGAGLSIAEVYPRRHCEW